MLRKMAYWLTRGLGIWLLILFIAITPLCADEDAVDHEAGDITEEDVSDEMDTDIPEDEQGPGGGEGDSGGSGDDDDN